MSSAINEVEDLGNDPDTYPALGFNPAPGAPANVTSLGDQVNSAARGLAEADRLLAQLRDTSGRTWGGDAADAFRSHVNSELAPDLEHAQESLTNAVGVLRDWHRTLVANKSQADELEREAQQARTRKAAADKNLESAQANPDLSLGFRVYPTQAEADAATDRANQAVTALTSAEDEAQTANNALNAVLKRAWQLFSEHERSSSQAAAELRACTNDLAPHKPGLLHRIGSDIAGALGAVGSWVKDHLDVIHDVLSTISSIGALLAVVTPPPVDAVCEGVALVAGAGALAIDFADPKFRKELFSGDPAALARVGGDVLSVVPGANVFKGAKGLEGGLKSGLSFAAKEAPLSVKTLAKLPGVAKLADKLPLVDDAVKLGQTGRHAAISTLDRLNVAKNVVGVSSKIGTDVKKVFG